MHETGEIERSYPVRISGFTMIRNGILYDYPFLESLESLLPLVDELVVNVGYGQDDTYKAILNFVRKNSGKGKKFIVFQTRWPLDDPEKRRKGQILADQTNLALKRCNGNWCVYLQADEVLHEGDVKKIREALNQYETDSEVDGLLFDYRHLYGSYDIVQDSRSAYRREVRVVKRSALPQSVGDAQSFRKEDGSKLSVVHSGGRVFHYGWVRTPGAMKEKTKFMDGLYHGASNHPEPHSGDNYRYKRFWGLKRFAETHPEVMKPRIEKKNWNWDFENSPFQWSFGDLKKICLDTIEKWTGIRLFEYQSYRLIKK